MILGIGIDISRIERIERFLERYGERFTRRILTDAETGRNRALQSQRRTGRRTRRRQGGGEQSVGHGLASGRALEKFRRRARAERQAKISLFGPRRRIDERDGRPKHARHHYPRRRRGGGGGDL